MENKRMFKCLNLKYTFKNDWAFTIGRSYELEEENKESYTFKLKDDEGRVFYLNAPKECFEEVKNIVGYKLIKPEYEGAASAILWNYPTELILKNIVKFNKNSVLANRLEKAGVLDLWFEPVYEEAIKVPKVNGLELEIRGDKIFFGEYSLPKEYFNGIKYLCLEKDSFFISASKMNEIKEYLKTI